MNYILHTFQSFVDGVFAGFGSAWHPISLVLQTSDEFNQKHYELPKQAIFSHKFYSLVGKHLLLLNDTVNCITNKGGGLELSWSWSVTRKLHRLLRERFKKIYRYKLDRQHAGFIFNIDSLNFDSVCIWILEMSWHISWKVTFSPLCAKAMTATSGTHIWSVPHS